MKTLCLGGAAHGLMVGGSVGILYIPYAYCYSGPKHGVYSLYVPTHWWAYNLVLVDFPGEARPVRVRWPRIVRYYYLWDRLHGDQVDWDLLRHGLPAGTAWLKGQVSTPRADPAGAGNQAAADMAAGAIDHA